MNSLENRRPANCGLLSTSAKMQQMMNKKISEAIGFASRASIYNADITAIELTTAQSILLSLMHSLLLNDMGFCISLLELAQSVDHLRSSYLPTWLKDDFNFNDGQVIQVISRLALLANSRLLIVPSYIEKVFAGLAQKYKVFKWCKATGSTDVLNFLSGFGITDNNDISDFIPKSNLTIPFKYKASFIKSATKNKSQPRKGALPRTIERVMPCNMATEINQDPAKEDRAQSPDMQEVWIESSSTAMSPSSTSQISASTTPTATTVSSSIEGASSLYSNISTVKEFLKVPEDFLEEDMINLINYADKEGTTPLHNAVKAGDPYIVECMLGLGAKVDAADTFGYTPVHCAASIGSVPILQVLSQHQANLSLVRHDGCTPLHEAIINGHTDAGKWLLDHGADINTRNEDGWSPLHLAAQWDQLEMVRLLIAKGADLEVYNNNGKSAIDIAREEGNMSIVQLLSEKTDK